MLIYKVVNKNNGMVYIGQTIHTVHSRWVGHIYTACVVKHKSKFYTALREDGEDAFYVVVIEDDINDCVTLNHRERYWIKFYDSIKNGYNTIEGGDVTPMHDIGTRNKVSNALMGHTLSDEAREKLRKAFTGRKLSAEHAKKISLGNTGKPGIKGIANIRSKGVLQKDLKGNIINYYESIHLAEVAMGKGRSHSSISRTCSKQQQTAYGFIWEYQNKGDLNV